MNGPRVKLFELREYVSEKSGNTYFSGFLGKAKVVVLRDERAECTGREKARWSVLLEEQEPREDSRAPRGNNRSRNHLPEGMVDLSDKSPRPRQTAADRRAGEVIREMGIDPESDMPRDEMPF